ncbi:MAG: SsrA-binding protein [Candidatus Levybacteria bacterium RIFCSPLOWO2_01_FULL_36_13]|nr:MAG: SsrA-binding protein [Candidatus Levybacteria bacterium RIFCSPHIGHO2_01_FULL_36_15b]OGH34207.1 MAG: SsrA-binding protein [Candidatus Levybacteria bacterium RIFCSPLOWO2_01_FULL_36_13]
MKITNRKAFFEYEILETFEAGINLYGHEVKSARLGKADLAGSFVRILGSEIYLVNAKIWEYQPGQIEGYDEGRTRKLLLHKKQIISLKSKTEGSNLSLVPISMYLKNGFIKVEVGLGRGKKKYEKRQAIKKRDLQRDLERELG